MLTEIYAITVEKELHEIYDQLVTSCNEFDVLQEDVNIPDIPDISDGTIESLITIMSDAEKRYAATKKGLSLVSKLKPGPERSKHFSRITSNMNKLRGYNNRIDKAIDKLIDKSYQ